MLDTVEIAKKIKSCAKNKGIRLCDMLKDLGLSVNAISNLSAGSGMSYIDFANIADYLGVSVDMLLGIDNPLHQNFFANMAESELTAMLNQMSDEDLRKVESYAAFLVAEKEKEKEPPASSGE